MGSACSSAYDDDDDRRDFNCSTHAKVSKKDRHAAAAAGNSSKVKYSSSGNRSGVEFLMHQASVEKLSSSTSDAATLMQEHVKTNGEQIGSDDVASDSDVGSPLKPKSSMIRKMEPKKLGPLIYVNRSSPKKDPASPAGSPTAPNPRSTNNVPPIDDGEHQHQQQHSEGAFGNFVTINVVQSSTHENPKVSPPVSRSTSHGKLNRQNSLGVGLRSRSPSTGSHLRSPRESSNTAVPDTYQLPCFDNSQEFSRDGAAADGVCSSANNSLISSQHRFASGNTINMTTCTTTTATTPTASNFKITSANGSTHTRDSAHHQNNLLLGSNANTPKDLMLCNSSLHNNSSSGPLVPLLATSSNGGADSVVAAPLSSGVAGDDNQHVQN